ncbi:hypothetical protein FEM48_Zijuj10G0034500 [Ziziphus jujuba var. spinosa]|uniref:Receptor-like protein EIX2 n=1 Tax=Ziziphus jujuba var. spinosa TaxID=714518 RepID=A0A978UL10_ZIZJJ|nr:hypothetical protein FEM48_Zijuj10G0034500 [Ziziphus jujuba var. spinosa]
MKRAIELLQGDRQGSQAVKTIQEFYAHGKSLVTSLTSLSHLNLSYNNLSGPIPLTKQLQTLNDASIYKGNPGLLPKDRGTTEDDEDGSLSDNFWFYVSMGLGFIFGFWAVCGSLAIKRSWRRSYFEFLDKTKDRILLVLALNAARLQRMMKKMEDN